jgi:hypothetical protein
MGNQILLGMEKGCEGRKGKGAKGQEGVILPYTTVLK